MPCLQRCARNHFTEMAGLRYVTGPSKGSRPANEVAEAAATALMLSGSPELTVSVAVLARSTLAEVPVLKLLKPVPANAACPEPGPSGLPEI
mmetsp:Transcript_99475/g.176517  ORF Transcript_99475/g.176517 Transcript_99475/m.176517 type:complete len:92 (+) Transcript_99475:189-464(+)